MTLQVWVSSGFRAKRSPCSWRNGILPGNGRTWFFAACRDRRTYALAKTIQQGLIDRTLPELGDEEFPPPWRPS